MNEPLFSLNNRWFTISAGAVALIAVIAAAVAGAMWVVVGTFGPRAEAWAPGLFVPAAVALSLFLLPGAALGTAVGRRLLWVPVGLLGLAGVALAGSSGDEMARFGVLLLGPVTVTKGWREPRLAWLPHLAGVLFLLVLLRGHRDTPVELPGFRFSQAVHPVGRVPVALNSYALWLALMIGLSVVNYGYPISLLIALKQTSVPAIPIGGAPVPAAAGGAQ